MAYSGYMNPEIGAYEEYLHPLDTTAVANSNNVIMQENTTTQSMAVPLKYEQVMVGGTVYFNPVYVEDYQNFETTDGIYQESGGDQEPQEQSHYAAHAAAAAAAEDSAGKNNTRTRKCDVVVSKKTKGKKSKNRKHGTKP
jgi:tRNA A37 N6-isopentenylltransferase MiaA